MTLLHIGAFLLVVHMCLGMPAVVGSSSVARVKSYVIPIRLAQGRRINSASLYKGRKADL